MLDDVMSGWKWHVEAFASRLGFLERHAAPRECPDWSAFHGVHALDSHADLGDIRQVSPYTYYSTAIFVAL